MKFDIKDILVVLLIIKITTQVIDPTKVPNIRYFHKYIKDKNRKQKNHKLAENEIYKTVGRILRVSGSSVYR